MKRNLLMGFMVASMSFANLSHADFTLSSSAPNACDTIAGNWAGTGKSSNWVLGECRYHGTGTISTPDSSGKFTLEVSADKDSGNSLCPSHAAQKITGFCNNGAVKIPTEYGNLNGSFSQNSGNAKGTLSVAPGMDVTVTVEFKRAG